MKTTIRIIIFLLLLILGVSIMAVYWTFYKPLPDYTSTLTLPGLQAEVDIHWDTFGVPHIYADNESDLYYAVGYVHAQDRLWQMTLSQITAEGRFAEFLGEDLIEFDQYQRILGFWQTANKIEQEAPAEIQQVLESYSRGVNDYVSKNRNNLPIEFTLLGIDPIEWTPTHSYAMSRLMAWEMNVSWWSEMTFAVLAETLPASTMQELFPVYSDNDPTMMDDQMSGQVAESILPMIDTEFRFRELTRRSGTSVGSNAWAVSGSRTMTGYPILAGDPHMGMNMPGNWYEIHLSLNGKNISGGTIPGAPVVVLGQNDEFAWSMTNMTADDTDFFIELANPEYGSQYVADSLNGNAVFESFIYDESVLKIKDSDDKIFRARKTKHGPVISDIYPNEELIGDYLISMKWTGHEISHELWSMYNLNWAESLDEFRSALEHFKSPGQNFTYADRSGNIAIYSAAQLPIRDYNPIVFRKGWDPSYDWQGWIPFEELPRIVNPDQGYVANANNKLHTDSYPHYLATFWEPHARIERIEEYFTEHDTLNIDIFQEMQFDSYSVLAREIVERILPVLRLAQQDYDFADIAPYLENWDFRYDPESTAATILDTFFMKLTRNTLYDDLGEAAYENFIRTGNVAASVMFRLLQDNSLLFNNTETEATETREDIIVQSMQDAVDWLTGRYGEEPFEWRWEAVHTLTLKPPLFSEASSSPDAPGVLKLIVNNLMSKGPYAVPGNSMSLNKGQYSWLDPFEMNLGPSIRRIVDLSNQNRIYSVIPTGQSGNPLSQFFGDQTELWLNGQYRYIYQDSTLFRETSFQTMKLLPENP
jgi:penicillin G amidase